MNFTSFYFWALFLPISLLIYWGSYLLFKKAMAQNLVLLLISFVFYGCFNWHYLIILAVCIFITYIGGRTGKKYGYLVFAILNLSILFIFKYTNFIILNFNALLFDKDRIPALNILLPIGLSFYIFQSTSYLLDLYFDKIKPEKNLITYAVYVSFFPTIVSGPIQKSKTFLEKFKSVRKISYYELQNSIFIFLYGAFLKMVIADRIALLTGNVFSNYLSYSGFTLLVAALLYSLQIYTDFAGYSYMAIAVARMFGFFLEENFKQPYFSKSIVEFWRRWHISLTSWFRDYLYIPLGGNRKGSLRKYINIMVVFLVSGLWHGASWSFIIWGGVHAIYQIIGLCTQKQREGLCRKLNIDRDTYVYKIFQMFCVYFLATVAWIFFRMEHLKDALYYCYLMFRLNNPWVLADNTLYNIGLSEKEWKILVLSILIFILTPYFRETGYKVNNIVKQQTIVRWICLWGLLFGILIFGIYGPNYSAESFIYAGF